MSWTAILIFHLVLCSAMMFLCRKGDNKKKTKQSVDSKSELQSLQIKMGELMEQNQKLKKEYQSLHESTPNRKSG
jgi:hypothetical protein